MSLRSAPVLMVTPSEGRPQTTTREIFKRTPPLPIMELTAFEDLFSQQSACEIYDCMSLGDSFNCPRTWGMCLIDGGEKKPSDYSVSQTLVAHTGMGILLRPINLF